MTRLLDFLRALAATWRGRFILAFVAVQLLLPLHYYLLRGDPHDERFAWRMFSPMRMTKCRATFTIDQQPVNLGTEFHEAWSEIAERGRVVVIEAMADKLCRTRSNAAVAVTLECSYLDQPAASYRGSDMCKVPSLERVR